MPALRKPESVDYQELPPRQALRAGQTDVLIVGGGPAGLGAALGARQTGAQVILAERYGFLGGNATAALVMPLMSFHTQQPVPQQTGNTSLLRHAAGVCAALAAQQGKLPRDVHAREVREELLAQGANLGELRLLRKHG